MINQALSFQPSNVFYPVAASQFQSSIMQKTLSGVSSNNGITVSFWYKTNSNDTVPQRPIFEFVTGTGTVFQIYHSNGPSRKIGCSCFVWTAGTSLWSMASTSAINIASGWKHFLISINMNFSSGNRLYNMYIDGVNDSPSLGSDSGPAFNAIDNPTGMEVGGDAYFGTNYIDGCLAEFYVAPGYTDFSVLANRRKFLSATKRPVFLGSDGSLPSGSQPLIYLKGSGTGFNVNSGSLGNFTTTGTLTVPTSTPSAP